MGYNENTFSLPAKRAAEITRANLFDYSYQLTPTQGWGFLSLEGYHDGGDSACFLDKFDEYELAVAAYMGAGVAACYRGSMPYLDRDEKTQNMLSKWLTFYKKYRYTLIQPMIHTLRPTLTSYDAFMHANPTKIGGGEEVAVGMIFNPTDVAITKRTVKLNLYYTGLTETARVVVDDGEETEYTLNRDYTIDVEMTMEPRSIHTVIVR